MSCGVCDLNPAANNKIVKCKKCGDAVHQKCYGLRLKDIKYSCDYCVHGKNSERQCVLCPVKAGPLKRTICKQFVHVVCAIFIKEAYFRNVLQMRNLDISEIVNERYNKHKCIYCGSKIGVCLKCNYDGCKTHLHATCAREFGSLKEIEVNEKRSHYVGYCIDHSGFERDYENTGDSDDESSDVSVDRSDVFKNLLLLQLT